MKRSTRAVTTDSGTEPSSSTAKKRNLGRRDALQELEFLPPRVEVRDFVTRRFQLSFQLENLGAWFRIKIRDMKAPQNSTINFLRPRMSRITIFVGAKGK